MSELEKAIDQKLADARKQSEVDTSQKTAEVKIKQEPGTENSSTGGDKKVVDGGKSKEDPKTKREETKKVESGSGKKDDPKKGADDRKDRSGGDRKDGPSTSASRRPSGSDRRDDHRRGSGHDRRDESSRSYRTEHDDRRRGTSNRDREEPSRNGSRSSRVDDKDRKDVKTEEKKEGMNDKTKDDKSKKDEEKEKTAAGITKEPETPEGAAAEAAKPKKKKNKKPKVTINDGVDWDITRDFGTSTDDIKAETDKEEPSEEWQVLSEDHENDGRTSKEKSRERSKEKEKSRERSPTPPWSTRYKSVRGRDYRYQNDRRSPPRRRSRSRETSRRRSRSPVRNRSRSPRYRRSPPSYSRSYRAPSRRYSPRRSRSPARRRSRSRSRISSDRGANPKALLAKKSFLDDLAVKFAQEGKEFPELEQYRCEINSQFSSGSYMPHSMDHVPGCVGGSVYAPPPPMMGMPMMGGGMYEAPYPMTTPDYVEAPPLVAYPIAAASAPAKPSTPMMIPLEDIMASVHSTSSKGSSSVETIMPENKVAVSDLLISKKSSLGSLPEPVAEKGFVWRGDAKTRISQAIQLLDDMELSVQRSGKFMYRSQTYYENNIDENRSPILQGPNNPRFSFNTPQGESNDPFGNIPKNIKPVIKALCLDEGKISEQIFLRTRRQQLAATLKKKKQEMEERKKRAMANNAPKAQLQKTTQTDPIVCTECLIRKLKFRATAETQTVPIPTTDSVVQTNPMPVATVTEFGSITELTPNQVRAVSELIRYIKLTATTGSVDEMRNSMLRDQMYNVNGDLRNAYQYFDAMVEHKKKGHVVATPQQPPQEIIEAIDDEPSMEDIMYADDNDGTNEENWDDDIEIDEYEKYHRTFGEDGEETAAPMSGSGQRFGQSTVNQYQDPKTSFQNNPLAPQPYGSTPYGGGLHGRGGSGRGKFQQRGGRGRGGKKNARGGKGATWK